MEREGRVEHSTESVVILVVTLISFVFLISCLFCTLRYFSNRVGQENHEESNHRHNRIVNFQHL